jgi:hypothetical protein
VTENERFRFTIFDYDFINWNSFHIQGCRIEKLDIEITPANSKKDLKVTIQKLSTQSVVARNGCFFSVIHYLLPCILFVESDYQWYFFVLFRTSVLLYFRSLAFSPLILSHCTWLFMVIKPLMHPPNGEKQSKAIVYDQGWLS